MTLVADATAPQNDALLFTWSVTGGRLRAEGRKVTWDVAGLGQGVYTATVEVNDGNQHTSNASTTVTISYCSDCMTVVIPCASVYVSCPSAAESKQPIVFEAILSGGSTELKITYTWTLSGGKIISGQGTPKITVDASDLGGQTLTATVTVGGFDPKCPGNVASCRVDEIRQIRF